MLSNALKPMTGMLGPLFRLESLIRAPVPGPPRAMERRSKRTQKNSPDAFKHRGKQLAVSADLHHAALQFFLLPAAVRDGGGAAINIMRAFGGDALTHSGSYDGKKLMRYIEKQELQEKFVRGDLDKELAGVYELNAAGAWRPDPLAPPVIPVGTLTGRTTGTAAAARSSARQLLSSSSSEEESEEEEKPKENARRKPKYTQKAYQSKLRDVSRLQKELAELQSEATAANDRATDLRRQLDGMRIQFVEEQNLRAVSEEALAEMEAQLGVTVARDRMQVVEHNLSKIKTFEGGRYTAPL
eukprot:COSAG01_NODE_70_length_28755_cov_34.709067_6_plen_299_part_00